MALVSVVKGQGIIPFEPDVVGISNLMMFRKKQTTLPVAHLQKVDWHIIQEARALNPSMEGTPYFYSFININYTEAKLYLFPTPDAPYLFELYGLKRFTAQKEYEYNG